MIMFPKSNESNAEVDGMFDLIGMFPLLRCLNNIMFFKVIIFIVTSKLCYTCRVVRGTQLKCKGFPFCTLFRPTSLPRVTCGFIQCLNNSLMVLI